MNLLVYFLTLFLMNGGMSLDLLGMKNWIVSPMNGNPMEPGGSFPILDRFLHFSFQWKNAKTMRATMPVAISNMGNIIFPRNREGIVLGGVFLLILAEKLSVEMVRNFGSLRGQQEFERAPYKYTSFHKEHSKLFSCWSFWLTPRAGLFVGTFSIFFNRKTCMVSENGNLLYEFFF